MKGLKWERVKQLAAVLGIVGFILRYGGYVMGWSSVFFDYVFPGLGVFCLVVVYVIWWLQYRALYRETAWLLKQKALSSLDVFPSEIVILPRILRREAKEPRIDGRCF